MAMIVILAGLVVIANLVNREKPKPVAPDNATVGQPRPEGQRAAENGDARNPPVAAADGEVEQGTIETLAADTGETTEPEVLHPAAPDRVISEQEELEAVLDMEFYSTLQLQTVNYSQELPRVEFPIRVGDIGTVSRVEILQVIGRNEATATCGPDSQTVWLRGWSTRNLSEDSIISPGEVRCTGTETYITVLGASKTVVVIEPLEDTSDYYRLHELRLMDAEAREPLERIEERIAQEDGELTNEQIEYRSEMLQRLVNRFDGTRSSARAQELLRSLPESTADESVDTDSPGTNVD